MTAKFIHLTQQLKHGKLKKVLLDLKLFEDYNLKQMLQWRNKIQNVYIVFHIDKIIFVVATFSSK